MVFKELRLKSTNYNQNKNEINESDKNRFRTSIIVSSIVRGSDKEESLNLDYTLYSYIKRLNSGFKPNKSDKEALRILDEFISALIPKGDNDYLIVNSLNEGIDFGFEFDDEGETYEFRRI